MALVIPIDRTTSKPAHFDLQVALDGVTYTLEFRWNVRASAWFMAVLDAQGVTAHVVGVKLVVDYPLNRFSPNRTPPGLFMAIDTSATQGMGEDPGFDDLGNRVQIAYLTAADLGL
jgi:hypothetical protein